MSVRWTKSDLKRAQGTETRLSRDLRYVIGIDPGKTTGLAVWDREAEGFHDVVSTDFWGCVDHVTARYGCQYTGIIIEDPDQKDVTVYSRLRGARGGKAHRIAANIGSNRREAQLLIKRFRDFGYDVMPVEPTGSKWDAKTLERITGWSGSPCNSHTRDAQKLCFQQ